MSLEGLEVEDLDVWQPEIVENVEVDGGHLLLLGDGGVVESPRRTLLGLRADQQAWVSPLDVEVSVECDAGGRSQLEIFSV